MRLKHLPMVLSLMPTEVQAGIREVTKKTSEGDQRSGIKVTRDTLFLLSEVEVFGAFDLSFEGEGHQYAYYTSDDRRKKSRLGSNEAEYWLERSPYKSNDVWYCCVTSFGNADRTSAADNNAIAPAFCF